MFEINDLMGYGYGYGYGTARLDAADGFVKNFDSLLCAATLAIGLEPRRGSSGEPGYGNLERNSLA